MASGIQSRGLQLYPVETDTKTVVTLYIASGWMHESSEGSRGRHVPAASYNERFIFHQGAKQAHSPDIRAYC